MEEALALPGFQQVGNFPAGGNLIANSIRVDIFYLRRFISCDHDVSWMNYLPDTRNGIGLLNTIDKAPLNSGFLSLALGFAKILFGLWVIQIGINHFKEARCAFELWLPQIQEHYWLIISNCDGSTNNSIITPILGSQDSQHRTR